MLHEQMPPPGKPMESLSAFIERSLKHVWQTIKQGKRNEFAIEKSVPALLSLIEFAIVKRMVPELPVGFEDAFREQMKDEKTVPIVVSSHQGHADLITILAVSKTLTDLANHVRDPQGNDPENRFNGLFLPVAASIRAGKQGTFLQQCLIQAEKKYLPKYPLILADIVRQKDVDNYGMPPNKIAFVHKLEKSIEEGYGIAIFPEGNVEGGRFKEGKNGNAINGMQQINCDNLNTVIQIVIRKGCDVLLIPVASRGAHKIADSNLDKRTGTPANRVTLKELAVLSRALLIGENPINARLGMPIIYVDMVRELGEQGKTATAENIANFLGRKMAELLPENERGVYA